MVGYANQINPVYFNATTLKLAEEFDHPFSHFFTFGNIIAHGHGFEAVTGTSAKYFVYIH